MRKAGRGGDGVGVKRRVWGQAVTWGQEHGSSCDVPPRLADTFMGSTSCPQPGPCLGSDNARPIM